MKRGMRPVLIMVFVSAAVAHASAAGLPSHVAAAAAATAPFEHATSASDELGIALFIVLLTGASIGSFMLAVAMNFRKSLATDPADAWESPRYRSALPNVLARLRSRGFETPWPRHCNPWSMHHFERQLRRVVRPMLRRRAEAFVEQHLAAWIWVESHRKECQTLLRLRQVERALEVLSTSEMSYQRAGVLAFLDSPGCQALPSFDKKTARRLRLLQSLQIVMREHGYTMAPELAERDLLERAPQEDLVDLLLPPRHGRRAAAARYRVSAS